MPIYQCAAPVGLLTRDMKARIAPDTPRSRCCSMESQLLTRAERT